MKKSFVIFRMMCRYYTVKDLNNDQIDRRLNPDDSLNSLFRKLSLSKLTKQLLGVE